MKRQAVNNSVKSEAVSRDVDNSRTVKGWPPSASTVRVLKSCRFCHWFLSTFSMILGVEVGKVKGKFHPITGHEVQRGRCIVLLFL